MIQKIIHYCWFGGNPLPPLVEMCIESWKKHCPDFELIQWDESNFDVSFSSFVKEAYIAKRWSIVSDIARLWALTTHGGIYMDTDVELIRPIDEFLVHEAVSGFEMDDWVGMSFMGCMKDNELYKSCLDGYAERQFILDDGKYDMTTIVEHFTKLLVEQGLILNGKKQTVKGLTLYPTDYFYPKNFDTGILKITSNTYAIHHFDSSWYDEKMVKEKEKRYHIYRILGHHVGKIVYKLYRVLNILRSEGFRGISNGIKRHKAAKTKTDYMSKKRS